MNRGIFAINELPDLAERIQVALLNVLEERDIQIRGYQLRLPLDLLVVASANPEDYTNRGRIITPLKDRFGAEIRTHYPMSLATETELIRQEARIEAVVPRHVLDVVARFTREVRESPAVDQRSGVSARFAIACVEALAGAAVRRSAINGEAEAVARIGDLASVVPTLRGKVEFDVSEEGQEEQTLAAAGPSRHGRVLAGHARRRRRAAPADDAGGVVRRGQLAGVRRHRLVRHDPGRGRSDRRGSAGSSPASSRAWPSHPASPQPAWSSPSRGCGSRAASTRTTSAAISRYGAS